MSLVSNEITNMQNTTAFNSNSNKSSETKKDANDSSMFLKLMLQQLQNQDPTEPTSNTEWLSQLAQYSSLEQMTEMNDGFKDCMGYLSAMYSDITSNSEINQTLAMIGKEVTLQDPDDESKKITGKVTEASFEEGAGQVKVNGNYYSISNILSIRDAAQES